MAKHLDPSTAPRREPLTRERVLEAAMRLADDGGIESLTMRRLGQALGVEAMSLYNHVANKEDILGGLVALVLAEAELPTATDDWEAAVRRLAISTHEALKRHTWACALIMSSAAARPRRVRYMESLLGQLREAGFSADQTYHAYHVLDSHILGFTLWQAGHAIDGRDLAQFAESFFKQYPPEQYPYLGEHAEQHFTGSAEGDVTAFELGLDFILDGLKRLRLAA